MATTDVGFAPKAEYRTNGHPASIWVREDVLLNRLTSLVCGRVFADTRRQVLEAYVAAVNQTVNRALSAARAPVEPGIARLKSWRIFRKAWCSPNCMSSITTAILTLERHR